MLLSRSISINDQFRAVAGDILEIEIVENLSLKSDKDFDFIFINSSFFHFQKYKLDENHVQSVLSHLWMDFPGSKIFVFSKKELIRDLATIVRMGASDYITLPLLRDEVILMTEEIRKVVLSDNSNDYLKGHFWNDSSKFQMTTKNLRMKEVYSRVRQVSDKMAHVLLTGETGVGKSLIARLIHDHSKRKGKTFVSVHCGAIPDNLIESELFGHEKGSFTGAIKRKLGKFEIANNGTIFLDEIGTLTESAQIKLLNVIQDSLFQRVGGEEDVQVDVRIIAATNSDLLDLVKKGHFREDLYYRINVFPLEIPPLREREEDIPHFFDYFFEKYNQLYGCEIKGCSREVLSAVRSYRWPGNIRELENLVERACILEKSNQLELQSFPVLASKIQKNHKLPQEKMETLPLSEARQIVVDSFEKEYFENLLKENLGKVNKVSKAAGLGLRQTHKLLAKHSLQSEQYRKKSSD